MNDIPPVNTSPTTPVAIYDMGQVAGLMVAMFIVLLIVYFYYLKSSVITGADIRNKIEDMTYAGWSPNKMMLVQLLVIFPATFGMIFGLLFMAYDFGFGLIIICLVGFGTSAPYFYMKDRSREKNRNKYKLDGYLWLKDGRRIKYTFMNVSFGTEIMLTTEEEELLLAGNPDWEQDDNPLTNARVIPMKIDDKFLVYLIMKRPMSETFEWVDDEDFDYFGTLKIKTDGPELREVATLLKVKDIEEDTGFKVNEYIPTLLVLWDANRAKACVKNIAPIDVTADTVLAGLTKQIGAETQFTAGELNSKESALRSKNKGQALIDDLGESLGRKKAMEYLKNESRLTTFKILTNQWLWYAIGGLIMAAIIWFIAFNAGYAQAIMELLGGNR